jgi:hypothetical protein
LSDIRAVPGAEACRISVWEQRLNDPANSHKLAANIEQTGEGNKRQRACDSRAHACESGDRNGGAA